MQSDMPAGRRCRQSVEGASFGSESTCGRNMSARADRYDGPCRAVTSMLLALLLLAPSGVAAQVLVGRVVDDLTDDPIPFATALLIDSADVVASSAVADAQGHFLLHAPKPGDSGSTQTDSATTNSPASRSSSKARALWSWRFEWCRDRSSWIPSSSRSSGNR